MLKVAFKQFWLGLRQDRTLVILLLSAIVFFGLYYLTDPVRQTGLFPDWLVHAPPANAYKGWFGYYDQGQYLREAHTLAGFHWHELHSTYSYGVGYPLVAVPAIWLGFNRDPFVFFNLVAFVFAIYAVYTVARRLISPFAGFVAGFGLLFATPLLHYMDIPWNSSVCVVVMAAILLTLIQAKITKWHALMLGLLLGWAFAARYIDVIFLGSLALAAMYRGSLQSLRKPVLYLAIGAVIVATPVLYSHYKIFGSPFRTPYINHIGLGGVGGSDQGLQAYSLRRVPRAALALFVSPRLAGSHDADRGLLIDFFWALAAIPGAVLLLRQHAFKKYRLFVWTLLGVGLVASLFYLSFRASTVDSLKYGELHYFKMLWLPLTILAAAYIDRLWQNVRPAAKPKHA